jgi:hypothetical protein
MDELHQMDRRDVRRTATLMLAATLLLGCAMPATRRAAGAQRAAIARLFTETCVREIGAYRAFHFALRAWRATGEPRHLNAVTAAFERLQPYWLRDICGVTNAAYTAGRATRLAQTYHARSNRYGGAAGTIAVHGRLIYYKSVLLKLSTLQDLGLLSSSWAAGAAPAMDHMDRVDFAPLLSPEVIAARPGQVANLVWYLHHLGIRDLRTEFITCFRSVYPPADDSGLSARAFKTKTYGLTHIIINASGYYQRLVDTGQYEWILDWFERHWPRIREDTSLDVIGEVALCFVLCGRAGHPIVAEATALMHDAFDPGRGYIPRRDCPDDVKLAEHRNAVAFLLFNAPDCIRPGPVLDVTAVDADRHDLVR